MDLNDRSLFFNDHINQNTMNFMSSSRYPQDMKNSMYQPQDMYATDPMSRVGLRRSNTGGYMNQNYPVPTAMDTVNFNRKDMSMSGHTSRQNSFHRYETYDASEQMQYPLMRSQSEMNLSPATQNQLSFDLQTNLEKYKKKTTGPVHNVKYKAKLCKNWIQLGHCPYFEKCQFAHGEHEIEKWAMKRRKLQDRLTQELLLGAYSQQLQERNYMMLQQENTRRNVENLLAKMSREELINLLEQNKMNRENIPLRSNSDVNLHQHYGSDSFMSGSNLPTLSSDVRESDDQSFWAGSNLTTGCSASSSKNFGFFTEDFNLNSTEEKSAMHGNSMEKDTKTSAGLNSAFESLHL